MLEMLFSILLPIARLVLALKENFPSVQKHSSASIQPCNG